MRDGGVKRTQLAFGFEDRGKGPQAVENRRSLETGKDKEMGFHLQTPEKNTTVLTC